MRVITFTGAIAALLISGSATLAAATNTQAPSPVFSGDAAAMTCAEFTKMEPAARADLVKQIHMSTPTASLATTSGSSTAANTTSTNTADSSTANSTSATVPGTPLTGGQLVAACEAASPTTTLQDAYGRLNSGSSTGSN